MFHVTRRRSAWHMSIHGFKVSGWPSHLPCMRISQEHRVHFNSGGHMHTPEIQMPHSGRRRGRYSNDFKRQIIAACLAPGVSTAAIALANGLNANLVRRWVVESSPRSDSGRSKTTTALAPVHGNAGFVPLRLDPVSPASNTISADIRIELQHGSTAVQIHWPLQASGQCAQWLREVLA